ncbi:hypothetical protein V8D89_010415 [Ganoderma adspersum]
MSSFFASKKRTGARTSQQVAAPVEDTRAPISEPSVLETSGTLPHLYVPPIAESAAFQVSPRSPRLVAMDQELGRQWGIPDADQFSDSREDRSMTRTGTELARAGALTPTLDNLVYSGHDRMRVKNSRKVKQTNAETLTSDERDLYSVVQASISMAVEECEKREWRQTALCAMAVLIEVDSDDNSEPAAPAVVNEDSDDVVPEIPAGQNRRYSSKRHRNLPHTGTKNQREFLRHYVSGTRARRGMTKPAPSSRKGNGKAPQGPAQFKREPSLVPEGGWFRASTTAGGRGPPQGPPSSSSSSDPDSSSSDSSSKRGHSSSSSLTSSDHGRRGKNPSKKRHHEKQKREMKRIRKALAGVKIKPPFSWDGTPDLDLFDQWTYEVDTWRELYGLSDKLSIKLVVQFLTGTAGRFFMKHVATCQSEWNMTSLYEALFDYCFPTDYKAQLRLRLERAVQGRTKVRDFVREIQHLAARFPDVSDFQLSQIFWRGVHGYIRVYLIEKGLHPERTLLDKMVKYAARREEAYIEARRDERDFEGQIPGSTWGQFTDRSTGDEADQSASEPHDWREHYPEARDPDGQENRSAQGSNYEKGNQSEKLSQEQRDKLRAEGRCFTCGEEGHMSRNCSMRKTARAPSISVGASSIRFANLERLAERAREADVINVAGVRLDLLELQEAPRDETVTQTHLFPEPRSQNEGIWTRAHTADCIEYLLTMLVSYFDPEDACDADLEPEKRFTVRTNNGELTDSEFLIIDHLAPEESPDEFIVSRAQMDDPDWGIPDMLQEAWDDYASLPPRAEWGQGFPLRGVSDKRYPARFWFKAELTSGAPHEEYPSPFNPGYEVESQHNGEGYTISLTEGNCPLFVYLPALGAHTVAAADLLEEILNQLHEEPGRGFAVDLCHNRELPPLRAGHGPRASMPHTPRGTYFGCDIGGGCRGHGSRYGGRSNGSGRRSRLGAHTVGKGGSLVHHTKHKDAPGMKIMDEYLADDEPEAGPSGQPQDEESDFKIPEEDSGPEIGKGEGPSENDGFSNRGQTGLYTVFLGPIAGIMVADYWIVHKGKVDVPSMYRPHGRYRYSYGFNWRAVVAILLSVPPNMPGLIASINPKIDVGGAIKIFDFAWLFGFFVALTVYSALSLGFPAKETYIPEAIISEDVTKNIDGSTESEKSSHHDKEVMEGDLKLV